MPDSFGVNPTFAFLLGLPAIAIIFCFIPYLAGRIFLDTVMGVIDRLVGGD